MSSISISPWKTIKILHRSTILILIIFIFYILTRFIVFESIAISFFDYCVFGILFVGEIIIILWPNTCPQCKNTFLIWSVPNWYFWFKMGIKYFFSPIQYFSLLFLPSCPHCGAALESPIEDPSAPPPEITH